VLGQGLAADVAADGVGPDLPRSAGLSRPRPLPLASAAGLLLAVFLGLPLLGLALRALGSGGLLDALARPLVLDALRLSALATGLVLVLSLVLGTPLALLLARRRFAGMGALDTLVDLPIVLPPAVAGLALLLTFGRRGLLGGPLAAVGLELPFTTAAVVLASLFVAAPFYVRAARAGFLAVPIEIEEAARVDGCRRLAVLRRIVLPLAAPGLAAVAAFSFLFSYSEFFFALLTTQTAHAKTIPVMTSAISVNPDASFTLIAVGMTLSIAAPLAFALIFRRYITTGLVASLTRA
jgi:molybdate transport system permease protein